MTAKQKSETRRWLSRYRIIKNEITARETEVTEFIKELYNPLRSSNMLGGSRSSAPSDQTLEAVIRIESFYEKMIEEMQTKIENLMKCKEEIENAINSLDEYERCVLYHRFILGIFWADMPSHIPYEQRQCQRIENKALEKVHKLIFKK